MTVHVFLAGATGTIGRQVLPLLAADGHRVTALTRSESGAAAVLAAGGTPVTGDVYDAARLAHLVRAASPDAVMHQLTDLGRGNLADNARIRTAGTRNLVDAALAAGVRRIVAQSISWVYEGGPDPAGEETPLDTTAPEPRRTTVAGVAALEGAVRELPEWVVLRYGLLYGPGTWYTRDGSAADRARAGELAADDEVASFVHVADAARAAALALSWPSGATVNIVDDEPAPARAWVPVFCEAVGAPPPAALPAGGRNGWARGADNSRARRDLGWRPEFASWRTGFLA
ncbi:NAD-dependent epimerase/dehydratase family protein [Streptomyces tsukubensis]|uniref:NAD-dependent epimerase/dehydratase family protein n=1 Tax=Streptomyces tsukubensis TaxID=83656 RepID=UPI00025CE350|nr:NAD(P)-dependent oxidoreductase [Streptomyces tsukubensis]EIF90735.1 dTDP-glucose 4,6-dehydratase [Streptomyces tsukubensis NRRL18488]